MIEIFILLVILSFISVSLYFKSSTFKGKVGEWKVNSILKSKLNSNYTIYEDLTFKLKGGRTTQIDHIIVSKNGIFVIETKNMKGWIFGSEKQKKWTQVIYGEKNYFQNPLNQNYWHIKSLSEVLNINEKCIYSIVVFTGDSEFKTPVPNNVFDNKDYILYVKSFNNEVFNDIELNQIKKRIETKSFQDKNIKKEHINNLKNKPVSDKKMCKKCGSKMVQRTNKSTNETFLGCSSYPKCRNTEKL